MIMLHFVEEFVDDALHCVLQVSLVHTAVAFPRARLQIQKRLVLKKCENLVNTRCLSDDLFEHFPPPLRKRTQSHSLCSALNGLTAGVYSKRRGK